MFYWFMWYERVKCGNGGSNQTFLAAEGSSTLSRILNPGGEQWRGTWGNLLIFCFMTDFNLYKKNCGRLCVSNWHILLYIVKNPYTNFQTYILKWTICLWIMNNFLTTTQSCVTSQVNCAYLCLLLPHRLHATQGEFEELHEQTSGRIFY